MHPRPNAAHTLVHRVLLAPAAWQDFDEVVGDEDAVGAGSTDVVKRLEKIGNEISSRRTKDVLSAVPIPPLAALLGLLQRWVRRGARRLCSLPAATAGSELSREDARLHACVATDASVRRAPTRLFSRKEFISSPRPRPACSPHPIPSPPPFRLRRGPSSLFKACSVLPSASFGAQQVGVRFRTGCRVGCKRCRPCVPSKRLVLTFVLRALSWSRIRRVAAVGAKC